MSLKEKAEAIIEAMSESARETVGWSGVPDYQFLGHKIVMASLGYNDSATLTVSNLRDFVKKEGMRVTDYLDEDEDA